MPFDDLPRCWKCGRFARVVEAWWQDEGSGEHSTLECTLHGKFDA